MRRVPPAESPGEGERAQAHYEAAVVRTLVEVCQHLRRLRPEPPYRRACDAVDLYLRARLVDGRTKGRRRA